MPPIPKLIKYSNGAFRLIKENLPELVKNDRDIQNKVLILVSHRYSHYDWKNMLPADRLNTINEYVYELLEEYFE